MIKLKRGLLSIVLSFYGKFDPSRAVIAIESIKAQRDVDIEIIISEQGERSKLKSLLGPGVKLVFQHYRPSPYLSDFGPGRIRNLAVSASRGEFLYATDADIVFLNPYYLKSLLQRLHSNSCGALYRPPLRRLPREDFSEFRRRVFSIGIQGAIHSLNFCQPFWATTDKRKKKFKIMSKHENRYQKTYTALPNAPGQEKAPLSWREDRHTGGVLMRRHQFDFVGGYCEKFMNWGCEDSDLQWKLSEFFKLKLVTKEQRFMVLHLDHPRQYISEKMWERNKSISLQRRNDGPIKTVMADLKIYAQ